MDASEITPGAVFRFPHDDRPCRVLLRDADVVMYDAWWPDLQDWGLSDLDAIRRKRITYYVTTLPTVVAKATPLPPAPLTTDELAVHRPDLPFVALRDPSLTWSADDPGHLAHPGPALPAPAIYLVPFGPAGGTKTAVRVTAADGAAFTGDELLRHARTTQARHTATASLATGVGIYRSGLQRGLPAYYLWGAASRLHEQSGDHPA